GFFFVSPAGILRLSFRAEKFILRRNYSSTSEKVQKTPEKQFDFYKIFSSMLRSSRTCQST
ncbi:MAG: hypothetical protein LUH14_06060, partial [Clostridiaceae bacterium]|nr:hypothetical protein [Clostridiaceae bacterium]